MPRLAARLLSRSSLPGRHPKLGDGAYTPNCSTLWSSYDPNATIDANFQIPGWAMVETSDLDSVKTVIANGGALSYGTALNSTFIAYGGSPSPMNGPFDKIKNPDGGLVGHCMLIIGYDDSQGAILIQNSSGKVGAPHGTAAAAISG